MNDAAALKILELSTESGQLRAMLQRILNHYVLNTRWPCPQCDRTDFYAPLRINRVITENGNEYLLGCSYCNADSLMGDVSKLLGGDYER